MLSNRPMKGITASPPPKSFKTHREEDETVSSSFWEQRDSGSETFSSIIYQKDPVTAGFLLTITISPKETMVPLAVVSEVGGGLNGGSPRVVFPVIVKTWLPYTSQENAMRDAAMTTAALRTDDIKKYNKNVMNRIFLL